MAIPAMWFAPHRLDADDSEQDGRRLAKVAGVKRGGSDPPWEHRRKRRATHTPPSQLPTPFSTKGTIPFPIFSARHPPPGGKLPSIDVSAGITAAGAAPVEGHKNGNI